MKIILTLVFIAVLTTSTFCQAAKPAPAPAPGKPAPAPSPAKPAPAPAKPAPAPAPTPTPTAKVIVIKEAKEIGTLVTGIKERSTKAIDLYTKSHTASDLLLKRIAKHKDWVSKGIQGLQKTLAMSGNNLKATVMLSGSINNKLKEGQPAAPAKPVPAPAKPTPAPAKPAPTNSSKAKGRRLMRIVHQLETQQPSARMLTLFKIAPDFEKDFENEMSEMPEEIVQPKRIYRSLQKKIKRRNLQKAAVTVPAPAPALAAIKKTAEAAKKVETKAKATPVPAKKAADKKAADKKLDKAAAGSSSLYDSAYDIKKADEDLKAMSDVWKIAMKGLEASKAMKEQIKVDIVAVSKAAAIYLAGIAAKLNGKANKIGPKKPAAAPAPAPAKPVPAAKPAPPPAKK